MKVIKKINNNVAVCLDNNNNELIAFGKGIGFQKVPYELTDISKIERTYYGVNHSYIGLVNEIPEDIFDISAKIVEWAKTKLSKELSVNIVFTLADHINFANGNPTFVITVKGNDLLGNSHEYSEFYEFTKEYVQKQTESDGYVSVKYTWKGIPAGNAYEVTENDVNRYYLSQVTSADENVSIERLQESAYGVRPEDTFRVIADLQSSLTGTTITFENEKYTWDDWSHNAIVKNTIQIIQSR